MSASWNPFPPREYLDVIADTSARFAEILATGDLAAAVPACPGWTLGDLGRHLGNVQRWALHALQRDEPGPDVEDGPTGSAELAAWMRAGTADLLAELRSIDPDVSRWGFGPKPRTAAFWFRRQAHEALIHVHDAETVAGQAIPIDARLAADGIDEVVRMFFPRQVRLQRCAPLASALALRPTDVLDADPAWVLAGDGTADGTVDGSVDAVLEGPAQALLLALWKRIGLDDPRLVHRPDDAVARAVLGQPVVP